MARVYPLANFKSYKPTRNPYGARIESFCQQPGAATLWADEKTELNKGRWREQYGLPSSAFLSLELGAYHGETSLELAKRNPQTLQLGIEWKFKQCFRAGKKARDMRLGNCVFLRANMAFLPKMFERGEVNRIWILFPDPWSKLSQQKWRVIQPDFLKMLSFVLAEEGELLIKTDHEDYAQWIEQSWQDSKCFSKIPEAQSNSIWKDIPPTPFERIFMRQGLKIHSFALRRKPQTVELPFPWNRIVEGATFEQLSETVVGSH